PLLLRRRVPARAHSGLQPRRDRQQRRLLRFPGVHVHAAARVPVAASGVPRPRAEPRRTTVTPADRTTTTTLLLESLKDPGNQSVWREFDGRYRSIIIGFARNLGLNEEDAHEVAQQTLTEFVRDFSNGKYKRDRGRLRSWIIGIAQHRIADLCRHNA